MDTTPDYIKMCEKAVEIQETNYLHQGRYDFWYCSKCLKSAPEHLYKHDSDWEGVWLPRQDQLQEIVRDTNVIYELIHFQDFVESLLDPIYDNSHILVLRKPFEQASWEQLWLGFVMKVKYGKAWNGDEWVACETRVKQPVAQDRAPSVHRGGDNGLVNRI